MTEPERARPLAGAPGLASLRCLVSERRAPRIESEVGVLRRVLVHRPGAELDALTPDNMLELLFDDVPWTERAAADHDAFCRLLTDRGVEVLFLAELLADVLRDPAVRHDLIRTAGADRLARLDPDTLARALIAGGPGLAPFPNQVFMRDSSTWVHDREIVGSLATTVRSRERLHVQAVYAHHPLLGCAPATHGAGVEGGDVLVLSPECVVVGVGERTPVTAARRLAEQLLRETPVRVVLAVEIPKARRTMHLETLVSMVALVPYVALPVV
jgi:arginine deiminase